MSCMVEPVCGARKRNDEGRVIEVFVGKIKESHDAVERHNRVIQGVSLRLAWKERTFHEACVDQRHFCQHIMSVAFLEG